MSTSTNITWHDSEVTKAERQERNGHKSVVIWFTGLSGSGKSTVSVALEKALFEQKITSYRLDGDNIRHGLNKNLGEVGKLMVDAGVVTMTAFISPYEEDRNIVRDILEDGEFIEVYTKCSLDECEARDPKGLYKKARSGEIKEFTGINAPYEEPSNPEIIIDTEQHSVEEAVEEIVAYLKEHKYL